MQIEPKNKAFRSDLIAGLTTALVAIPDALASGLLAGVSPFNGLYGLMIGMPIAAVFIGSEFMSVTLTSAMAIATRSALQGYNGESLIQAMVTIALVVGLFQIAAGMLRWGHLIRFISRAVMMGFVAAIALLIVLSQLSDLLGYRQSISSPNNILRTFDLIMHINQADLHTTIISIAALGLMIALNKTLLSRFSMLLAIIVTAFLAHFLGWSSVALVAKVNEGSLGFPSLAMLKPLLNPDLIASAITIGIIGLVQGAGISYTYPNTDGKYPDISKDFLGQGLANLGVFFFRGIPVGGSLSSTALMVNAGAVSRWANIFTGPIAITLVLISGGVIEQIPIATLSSMLLLAGIKVLKKDRILAIWEKGPISRSIMLLTFTSALILPIHIAIFLGIGAHHLLLRIFPIEDMDGIAGVLPNKRIDKGAIFNKSAFQECPLPHQLPSNQITVILPYEDLCSIKEADFERELPEFEKARQAVVVLVLSGQNEVGDDFLRLVDHLAKQLESNGGRLMLAEVSDPVFDQLKRAGLLDRLGEENVYRATVRPEESIRNAYSDAESWLARRLGAQNKQDQSANPKI